MKKIFVILGVAMAVLFAGYLYYTYEASKECRVVMTMARNMQEQGVISDKTAESVCRGIKRSCNMAYPVATLKRLERMHAMLQRELDEHNAMSMKSSQFEYAILKRIY